MVLQLSASVFFYAIFLVPAQRPHLFTTEEAKVVFVMSLLSGKALDWAPSVRVREDYR